MPDTAATTERLVLRDWRPDDRATFYEALNTPAVMRHLGGVQNFEDFTAGCDRIDGYARDFGHTLWIVEDRASGQLLGFCGLKRVNAPGAGNLTGTPEVGWRLREDAWGKGLAKEAAIASLDLAFGRFDYKEVVALTVAGNSASQGLMRRLGLRRREEFDYCDPRFGPDLNPTIVFSISADEWQDSRKALSA